MKPQDYIRYNFDSFESAFYTAFIILTLENWNTILISCLRADVTPVITILYLISWVFIGNYIFLNLFLAVLLEGFNSSEALQMIQEIDQEGKELERMHKALIQKREDRQRIEDAENFKANEEVLMIIEREKFKDKEEINQRKACYLVVRDFNQSDEINSEDFDLKKNLDKSYNKK